MSIAELNAEVGRLSEEERKQLRTYLALNDLIETDDEGRRLDISFFEDLIIGYWNRRSRQSR